MFGEIGLIPIVLGILFGGIHWAGPRVQPQPQDFIQTQGFIKVEAGSSLNQKLEAARDLARRSGAAQGVYWAAYTFPIRPGFAIDCVVETEEGTTYVNGVSVATDTVIETSNVGVFLKYNSAGGKQPLTVEVYNLDRKHNFHGIPVYWLGEPSTADSLALLNELVTASGSENEVRRRSVMAIALHDDPSIGGTLERYTASNYTGSVRESAVFWLGGVPGETPFLEKLAMNDSEESGIRKKAVFAIAVGKNSQALGTLERIYNTASSFEVRKETVFGAYLNKDKSADDFLIKVAEDERNVEIRKSAIFWLGQRAGDKTLKLLSGIVENDGETEVKKAAVFAISRRPNEEAVPLLMKIASTNRDPEVRKQAMFWLGRTGDPRAVEFFKDILTK